LTCVNPFSLLYGKVKSTPALATGLIQRREGLISSSSTRQGDCAGHHAFLIKKMSCQGKTS
jgi:hypothetical protein